MDVIAGAEKIEVFLHGHVAVHAEGIRHEADLPADLTRGAADRMAADKNLARVRLEQRDEHPHGGRFARAVRPDQPEDLAARNVQFDSVHGFARSKSFVQVSDFDDRGHGATVKVNFTESSSSQPFGSPSILSQTSPFEST